MRFKVTSCHSDPPILTRFHTDTRATFSGMSLKFFSSLPRGCSHFINMVSCNHTLFGKICLFIQKSLFLLPTSTILSQVAFLSAVYEANRLLNEYADKVASGRSLEEEFEDTMQNQ